MMRAGKLFDWIDRINEWVCKICFPLILLISIVVLYEIIMRAFFTPTLWSYEVTQYLFIICSVLPAGYLQKENLHIDVDIITCRLSQKTRVILKIATFPFFLLYVGALVYFGYLIAFGSAMSLETSGTAWDPYIFPIKFIMPIGTTLLLLQGIVNLMRSIQTAFFTQVTPTTQARKSEESKAV